MFGFASLKFSAFILTIIPEARHWRIARKERVGESPYAVSRSIPLIPYNLDLTLHRI